MDTTREHDIVLHGATGFVGALVAAYLAEAAPAGVRIALSGRSRDKLERTRAELPSVARGWDLVVADAADPTALAAVAGSTRVVVSTVGPYTAYGLPLVEACARAGTHYADLTGEVLFVREAIDRCDAVARESGARIVHSCGYDSVPSDLGVLLLHEAAGELADVRLVARMKGGFSGGTVASMRAQMDAVRHDPAARRLAADPHALSPDHAAEPAPVQPPDAGPPSRLRDGTWTAPFVMAGYNTRIVRRSNALLDWAYGRQLRYSESMSLGSSPIAPVASAVVGGAAAATFGLGSRYFRLLPRRLVERIVPKPGTGPSPAARERGYYRIETYTTTTTGARYVARMEQRGDPGYKATSVLLGECGLALAFDRDKLPDLHGVLTPAAAMGDALLDRFPAAGVSLQVDRLAQ